METVSPSASPSPKSNCPFKTSAQHVWDTLAPQPPPQDYPPISSIPRTPSSRLARAAPTDSNLGEGRSTTSSPYDSPSSSSNVLYLAYGSNLSSKIFLGRRGIRPISAVPVTAPSLRLTFDLPGVAYQEPCFANVAHREIPKPPQPPPKLPPKLPPGWPHPDPPPGFGRGWGWKRISGSSNSSSSSSNSNRAVDSVSSTSSSWDKGLVGVVYEVTPEDYAIIVKTEGGGAAYREILVPCTPFPEKPPGIPENPPKMPEVPKFFLALTLCAPRIPNKPPGDGDGEDGENRSLATGSEKKDNGDDGDDDDDDGRCKKLLDRLKDSWTKMMLEPVRPKPDYAQPSARYLKLITDGAAEHDLPPDYQRWLASLRPYTITSHRQALGKWLFLALVGPWMLLYLALEKWLAGDDGRVPGWFGLVVGTFFHLVWRTYDRAFKPVFGDGERTVEEEKEEQGWVRIRRGGRSEDGDVEEKASLLSR